ncbi:SDR family oxidoreductase [Arthrobacter oryzae]|uniref:SDR family oxidoreductase n=1 Tax=Arthrobacter oryzae TaxID=409290 RepID=UPI00273B6A51|nr:SDR family oxidoreductase [Arthrobacter oryzae]WLQ08755.1 SDR family oxidoreductase [Arthrobacter oryzae]
MVTGGARGIGLATALTLSEQGSNIVLTDLDAAALERAAATLGEGRCDGRLRCELPRGCPRCGKRRRRYFRVPGRYVNNAGFTRDAKMRMMTESDFDDVISVHLKGAWLGTRAAADTMRKLGTQGSIINVSSLSGKIGTARQTHHSAAKAGIARLTKAAAAGIRVNAIQPGIIRTEMVGSLRPDVPEKKRSEIPLTRFGEPEEVASVVLFLASGISNYMTGIILEITGGPHA